MQKLANHCAARRARVDQRPLQLPGRAVGGAGDEHVEAHNQLCGECPAAVACCL